MPDAEAVLRLSAAEVVLFTIQNETSAAAIFGHDTLRERSEDGLKRVYKKLALKLHPDKNTHADAHRAFQILQALFESTLSVFQAPPTAPHPHATTQQRGANPSSRPPPPPPPQQHHHQSRAPPPPPPQPHGPQPSYHAHQAPPPHADRSRAAAGGQTKRDNFDDDDIPLPPNIFEDMEWEEWTEGPSAGFSATGSSARPPPPPPPPPPPSHAGWAPPPPPPPFPPQQHGRTSNSAGAAAPPPPPPQQQHSTFGGGAPPAKGNSYPPQQHAPPLPAGFELPLPTLELSSGDEADKASRRRRVPGGGTDVGRRRSSGHRKGSRSVTQGTGLPSLDDGDGDGSDTEDEAADLEREIAKRYSAQVAAKKAQASAARRGVDDAAKRQQSSKTLRQLFSEFGISEDDDEGSFVTRRRPAAAPISSLPPSFSAGGGGGVGISSVGYTPVTATETRVLSPSGIRRATVPSSPAFGSSLCPNCGTEVAVGIDPSIAVCCSGCRKFFVPAMVTLGAAPGGAPAERKKQRSKASVDASGHRCRCGKAAKGACFLCE